MTKKQVIITFSSVLVASYVGFFFYQRWQRKKADEASDSFEDALQKLKDAKESVAPLYTEPDIEVLKEEQSELPEDATSMVDDKLYDLEYGYA
jgi:predicted negative regulator of RcsB-dependent stress response